MSKQTPRQQWLIAVAAKHAEGDLTRLDKLTNVSRTTLSQYVNGHKEVSDRHAIRISNSLKIPPPADLQFVLPDEQRKATDTDMGGITPELLQAIVKPVVSQFELLPTNA